MPERVANPPPAPSVRAALGWVAVALLAALVLLPLQTREPFADGTFYVSTLHSLVADGDIDLTNQAQRFPWLKLYSLESPPPPGGLRNPFPIGPPLLWSPFYLVADLADRALGGAGARDPLAPMRGPITFATTFWVVIGIGLLAATLARLGASRGERLGIPLAVAAVSPLPAYLTFAPDMSHGCAFAAVAAFLYACVTLRQTAELDSPRWIVCGLALGVVFLTRWQDVLLGVLPAVLLWSWREADGTAPALAQRARGAAWVAVGAFVGALPQLFYWKALYGTWLLVPGDPQHLGQGVGFLSLANADPLAFFFSTWNGAFLCHPALVLCLLGFAAPRGAPDAGGPFSLRGLRIGVALGVALQVASSLVVQDWWAGGSFGQRRFVSTLPFLALGLWALWRSVSAWGPRARAVFAVGIAALAAWNALSLYRLHERSLPYNPADPSWYHAGRVYDYYDWARRSRDVWYGAPPRARP